MANRRNSQIVSCFNAGYVCEGQCRADSSTNAQGPAALAQCSRSRLTLCTTGGSQSAAAACRVTRDAGRRFCSPCNIPGTSSTFAFCSLVWPCAPHCAGWPKASSHHFQQSRLQEALNSASPSDQALSKACKAGIARCTVRAGDARGGLQLALASGSKAAIRDCAELLATTGSLGTALEAGELYEAAGDTERAVALYLEAKAFARAAPLMGGVKNRKLVLEVSASACFMWSAVNRRQPVCW